MRSYAFVRKMTDTELLVRLATFQRLDFPLPQHREEESRIKAELDRRGVRYGKPLSERRRREIHRGQTLLLKGAHEHLDRQIRADRERAARDDFVRPRGAGGYQENGAKMRSEVYDFASAQRALERHGRKLGHNTTISEGAGGAIEVWLYSTCIVTYYPDGTIRLHSGGYHSVTTLSRINALLPPYLSVRGDGRGGWVVLEGVPRGTKPTAAQLKAGQPFFDGMRIGVR